MRGSSIRVFFVTIILNEISAGSETSGWYTDPGDIVADNGPCNIKRFHTGNLSRQEFLSHYAESEPIIIFGIENDAFTEAARKEKLLEKYGDVMVELASANTYSYKKLSTSFSEYINEYLKPQNRELTGDKTYFLFGDIDRSQWHDLLDRYNRPNKYFLPDHEGELSFGVAGAGTGVPFHVHGPGFAEVIYGRKRWFLYPFEKRPEFNPDATTLLWFDTIYPTLPDDKKPYECVMKPGEIIYFPNMWWHATLNVETAVFVSTFLSPNTSGDIKDEF